MAEKVYGTLLTDVKLFIEKLKQNKRYKIEDKKCEGKGGLKGGFLAMQLI